MTYTISINAPLGTTALGSSALFPVFAPVLPAGETAPRVPAPEAPVAPALPIAPQIRDLHSRKSKEEEAKRKVIERMPSGWLSNAVTPAETLSVPEESAPEAMALYRRFSTPDQKDASLDRQAGVETYAHLLNGYIAFVYEDKGKSGAFKSNRPGLKQLLRDAKAKKFKKVIIEVGNRLARDLGLTSAVFRELRSNGVEIHTPTEGKWSTLHAAFNGVMGEEARENLRKWTRGGIERAVLDGKWPGIAPYAFEKVPGFPGEMSVNDKKAEHVKWIFSQGGAGVPPAEISRLLNAKGIHSPRGKKWSDVQVAKLLRNALYIGLIFWFRTKTEKHEIDSLEIQRTMTDTPISEWRVAERIDWAIVDVELWNKVQLLNKRNKGRRRAAKSLLSGLISCAHCGSKVHAHWCRLDHVRMYCSDKTRNKRGQPAKGCVARSTTFLQCIEIKVVEAAAERLVAIGAAASAQKGYKERAHQEAAEIDQQRKRLEKNIADTKARLKGTFESRYTEGMSQSIIAELRADLNKFLDQYEIELRALPVIEIPDNPLEHVDFGDLSEFLSDFPYCKDFGNADEHTSRMLAGFQALIDRIELEPFDSKSFNLTIKGPIAHIGAAADDPDPVIRIEARNVDIRVPYDKSFVRARRHRDVIISDIVISDGEWEIMSPLLPKEPIWIEGFPEPIALRDVLNLVLFKNRKNFEYGNMKQVPTMMSFWRQPADVLRAAVEIANFWNIIDLFADLAAEHAPRLIDGINVRMKGRRSGKIDDLAVAFDRRNMLKKERALDPKAVLSLPKRYTLETTLS